MVRFSTVIREPTVLILGAGASQPYGFPLGGSLVDLIVQQLFDEAAGNVLLETLAKLEFRSGDMEQFREDLQNSGLRSIDAFLEGNADVYVDMGKVVIAHTILWHENRDLLFRHKPRSGHWYEYVWNLMRPDATPDNLRENQLGIVTFNYETSLEYYFTKAIMHSFRIREWSKGADLFKSSVSVVHLHGDVGEAEHFGVHKKPLNPQDVRRAAQRIRVLHDPVAQNDKQFKQTRGLIATAERVAFVGFGYHPTNVARLDVQTYVAESVRTQGRIFASAFKMGAAEKDRAQKALGVRATFGPAEQDALEFLRQFPVFA